MRGTDCSSKRTRWTKRGWDCAMRRRAGLVNTSQSCDPYCPGDIYNPLDYGNQGRALEESVEKKLCEDTSTISLQPQGLEWNAGRAGGETCATVIRIVAVNNTSNDFREVHQTGQDHGSDYFARCSELSSAKLVMQFEESDEKYLIDASDGSRTFRVTVADGRYEPSPKASGSCVSEFDAQATSGNCTAGG